MKESGRYTVLTNDHVIAVGSPDRIETNDGKIYPATVKGATASATVIISKRG
ncbi:MAG: hypothetical protein GDA48_28905 [Hormoscilla sp. GM102CHS1]|nr:hypothetical protein [Hormoscilla sp. GM102CHS1]